MGLTYGFYNSIDGDRKYDAVQLSSMFDGLIIDGVFASIGSAFNVKATTGNTILVGTGKAWFNHTWTINDSDLLLKATDSDLLLDRIDAVVLEVNASESIRANDIKIIEGTPATYPERPSMINDEFVHQYPLCFIDRAAASTEISQADITPMIGSEETPFIAAILKTLSLEDLLGKWQDELDQFVNDREQEFDIWFQTKQEELNAEQQDLMAWIDEQEKTYTDWVHTQEGEYAAWLAATQEQIISDLQAEKDAYDTWIQNNQSDFLSWFQSMKDQLSQDAAGNLQLQINDIISSVNETLDEAKTEMNNTLDKEAIKRILTVGFEDGTKSFSEDGVEITSISSDGRKLVKTFSSDFSSVTTVLSGGDGVEIARLVKTYDSSGLNSDAVITYS